jgi:hypothetical protein
VLLVLAGASSVPAGALASAPAKGAKTVKSIQRFVLSDAKRLRRDETSGDSVAPSVKFPKRAIRPRILPRHLRELFTSEWRGTLASSSTRLVAYTLLNVGGKARRVYSREKFMRNQ